MISDHLFHGTGYVEIREGNVRLALDLLHSHGFPQAHTKQSWQEIVTQRDHIQLMVHTQVMPKVEVLRWSEEICVHLEEEQQ
jgi:hypothetical protein